MDGPLANMTPISFKLIELDDYRSAYFGVLLHWFLAIFVNYLIGSRMIILNRLVLYYFFTFIN
jgi:hypothetical protein